MNRTHIIDGKPIGKARVITPKPIPKGKVVTIGLRQGRTKNLAPGQRRLGRPGR